jgi:hypothetical protein
VQFPPEVFVTTRVPVDSSHVQVHDLDVSVRAPTDPEPVCRNDTAAGAMSAPTMSEKTVVRVSLFANVVADFAFLKCTLDSLSPCAIATAVPVTFAISFSSEKP